jgi:hypothetical protein
VAKPYHLDGWWRLSSVVCSPLKPLTLADFALTNHAGQSLDLKVHKNKNFVGSDFEISTF